MSLDSSYIITDVTAVTWYCKTNLYLAGIGSSLYVYSADSTKPLQRLVCLNGQKIYGFKHRSDNECSFVVFGGKQFTIVSGPASKDDPVLFTRLFEPIMCDDWLHSAVWDLVKTEEVSVLTAHNVVQTYNTSTQAEVYRHSSKNNSILYSGLLLAVTEGVVVLAGTVYSEVIIHVCGEVEPLQRLKGHKGVILSISCSPKKDIIVTTSDDRSVRVWGPDSVKLIPWTSINYWRQNEIVCKHVLYGHNARVMRSSITDKRIISVGECSYICFWNHKGQLVHKVKRHQNSGIWSIEAHKELLLTGGGDGSISAQPIANTDYTDYYANDVIELELGKPKQIAYSERENLFILTDTNRFVYYDVDTKCCTDSLENYTGRKNVRAFRTISVSPCRKMCVLIRWRPLIIIYVETDDGSTVITRLLKTAEGKEEELLTVTWAGSGHLLVCTESGSVFVLTVEHTIEYYYTFLLPPCKERWVTYAAVDETFDAFVLADRSGRIHFFRKGNSECLRTFNKLHGRHGPTSIMIVKNQVITTGRDRTIKYYKINGDDMTHTGTKQLDFNWVAKFLDYEKKIICGFTEKMFVVYNLRSNEVLLQVECGGGHRSWDVFYLQEQTDETATRKQIILKMAFVKSGKIHTAFTVLPNVATFSIGNGSHSKEINCLLTHYIGGKTLIISGGEDTTLRVSTLHSKMEFEDIDIYKHLSSVRALKVYSRYRGEIVVISAGGRAQILIKLVKYKITNDKVEIVDTHDLIDYMVKGTDKERKGAKNWQSVSVDPEPDTRIMDLDYVKHHNMYTIFAGCSDARLRVFAFDSDMLTFNMINESTYTCILKTVCITFKDYNILITGCTRGEVAFWNATDVKEDDNFMPFFKTRTNKSGINSLATRILPDDRLLVATGGDDNAIHLNVINIPDLSNLSSMEVLYTLVLDKHHSSAVTGLCFVEEYILSTSVDQRITLCEWEVTDKIECEFVYQTFSDVADIKGMDVITQNCGRIHVCVFGKGMEILQIPYRQDPHAETD